MGLRIDASGFSVGEATAVAFSGSSLEIPVLLRTIIRPYDKSAEGQLIKANSIPWKLIAEMLTADSRLAFQIPPEKWEELIAAAFDEAGFDKVTLTPRSGDLGRDVIAEKYGVGSLRIIDSVKAYKPGHRVPQDDVRALLGVLHADRLATKAILSTTSEFAPGIMTDPFIAPFVPYRLELMDGKHLIKWLGDLAGCP